jgi:3-hydroxyacyl-CoA dehydrogenase
VIYPMINEAILALEEHIAPATDIDMAMIAGTGITYHGDRKGPLGIADEIGLDVVLSGLEDLHKKHGERFRPARLLRTKVRSAHLGVKSRRGFNEYA